MSDGLAVVQLIVLGGISLQIWLGLQSITEQLKRIADALERE